MPDFKRKTGGADIEIRLDKLLCDNCNSSTFDMGVVATDDPCTDCGHHIISRCPGCGTVACLVCTEEKVLHLRKQKNANFLAPLMGFPLTGRRN